MNLNYKKVFIAPHTPKTTMLFHELKSKYPNIEILGFIDKEKEADDIFKIDNISNEKFDYILIYSPNHFFNIYSEYSLIVDKKKILNIAENSNKYIINTSKKIDESIQALEAEFFRDKVLSKLVLINDEENKKDKIVFLSKGFVGTNNKMLLIEAFRQNQDIHLVSDNVEQLNEFKNLGIKVCDLSSLESSFLLASAKVIIQDQGNSNNKVKLLGHNQTLIQLWHGIPLKRMNKLVDVVYDYHISTSSYVNGTSLKDVIQAKNHLDYGYPRNDLLLKEHDTLDLALVDENIYEFAKNKKVIVYMPTHRESAFSFDDNKTLFPLNLEGLDSFLKKLDAYLILKLHPFVELGLKKGTYSNIIFYPSQSDIYPVLKYTDILVTDYSSIYFDFLLLQKPIIFFDYDYEEYSSNMNGFVYDYENNAPGKKVETQEFLEDEILAILNGKDEYENKRQEVLEKFFTYKDSFSSKRIIDNLIIKESK